MKNLNTDTFWTLNKDSEAIVYQNADGSMTEISLEEFLGDSQNNTAAQFNMFKQVSDEIYYEEDKADGLRAQYEIPLFEWSEKFISKTLEEQYTDNDDELHQEYLKRKKQMLELLPGALKVLTEIQKHRFLLHKVKRYTTREIAMIEEVTQATVFESIKGAEKKIKKYLLKIQKHPVKRYDY